MEKFIQTSIHFKRTPPKTVKDRLTEMVFGMQQETLTITIEYISSGDTTKITNEQLMDKLRELLGEELLIHKS